jgi:hypothetical protein
LQFLTELKRWLEEQLDTPNSGVSCVLSPYQLTIYYRGESVGSWRATREGAHWHGTHGGDAAPLVMRDVYDAIELTRRELSLRTRCYQSRSVDRGQAVVIP